MFRQSIILKPISLILIWTFVWSQVLWAVPDPFTNCDQASGECEEMTASRGGSPEAVVANEAQAQGQVDQLNALNELMQAGSPLIPDNLNFTLIDAAGNQHRYLNGQLQDIQTPEGVILTDILTGDNGLIEHAIVSLGNSVQFYSDGKVKSIKTDGQITHFNDDGTIDFIEVNGAVLGRYTYQKDSDGHITETTYTTATQKLTYDAENRLKRIDDNTLGRTTLFDAGKISKVYIWESRISFSYVATEVNGQTFLTLSTQITYHPEADLNLDGSVTMGDLVTLMGSYGSNNPTNPTQGDLNHDGAVGVTDAVVLRNALGQSATYETLDIAGDLNFDGAVDRADLAVFMRSYGKLSGVSMYDGDLNGDGGAGLMDLMAIQRQFGAVKAGSQLIPDIPLYLIYEGDALIDVTSKDRTRLVFADNVLQKAYNASGDEINFSVDQNPLGGFLSASFSQNEATSYYNQEGSIYKIVTGDLTLYYKSDKSLDYIKTKDGTKISSARFSSEGALLDAVIKLPSGEERTYLEGKLTRVKTPDEAVIDYDLIDGLLRPTAYKTREGVRYTFDYTLPNRVELNIVGDVPDAFTPIRMVYDGQFNLQETIRSNGESIQYLDNKASQINLDNATTFLDANEVPKYSIIKNGDTVLFILYDLGKIRWIYEAPLIEGSFVPSEIHESIRALNGAVSDSSNSIHLKSKYNYETDSNGEERTIIEDIEAKSINTYKNSELITSLDTQTDLLSTYDYYDATHAEFSGKVSKVTVTRHNHGTLIHTYTYRYENLGDSDPDNDITVVQDEEGIERHYGIASVDHFMLTEEPILDENNQVIGSLPKTSEMPSTEKANNKLLFMKKEKATYAYSYHKTMNSDESEETATLMVTESLTMRDLTDGSKAYYTDGRIDKVILNTGEVIDSIELNDDRTLKKASIHLASGITQVFSSTQLLEEILPSGLHYFYDTNNRLSRVENDPDYGDYDLSYDLDGSGQVQFVYVERETYRLKYAKDGSLLGMEIKGDNQVIEGQKVFTDEAIQHVVTHQADARITEASRFGAGAAWFDGANDALVIEPSSDFNFGRSDFTIEAWVNVPTRGKKMTIFSSGSFASESGGLAWILDDERPRMAVTASGFKLYSEEFNMSTDAWHHVAVMRKSGHFFFVVDGIVLNAIPATHYGEYRLDTNIQTTGNQVLIGRQNDSGSSEYTFQGMMDEVRVSGVARYSLTDTNNFPSSAFIMDSETLLLMHFNGRDKAFYDYREEKNASGTTTARIFEGLGGTARFDANWNILSGSGLNLPVSAEDLRAFSDYSPKRHFAQYSGDVHLDTEFKRFGNAAGFFDGSGDNLVFAPSFDWGGLGLRDFTVEAWINPRTANKLQTIAGVGSAGTSMEWNFVVTASNKLSFMTGTGSGSVDKTWTATSHTLTVGQWYHVAAVRRGNEFSIYLNGEKTTGYSTEMTNFAIRQDRLYIGSYFDGSSQAFNGYIDELRISKDKARYIGDFRYVLPVDAFTPDEDTVLLLHFDEENRTTFSLANQVMNNLSHGSIPDQIPHMDRLSYSKSDASGMQMQYSYGQLSEVVATGYDGMNFKFSQNRVDQITDESGAIYGQYSYDLDSNGNITAIWYERSGLKLKYGTDGSFLGVKFLDIKDSAKAYYRWVEEKSSEGVITATYLEGSSGRIAVTKENNTFLINPSIMTLLRNGTETININIDSPNLNPIDLFEGRVLQDILYTQNTTLTADLYCKTLTINPGVTLKTNGYKIFVQDTLVNNGAISASGNDGGFGTNGYKPNSNGGPYLAGNAGSGGSQPYTQANAQVGSGGSGGRGTSNGEAVPVLSGSSGQNIPNGYGGNGGSGGQGGEAGGQGGNGGQGGRISNASTTPLDTSLFNPSTINMNAGAGGGGGGGGYSNSAAGAAGGGGGGASGGGVVVIYAKEINNSNGMILADGGQGARGGGAYGESYYGSRAGGGAGGGGGGGGVIYLIYENYIEGDMSVKGGRGGEGRWGYDASGGQSGQAGADGSILKYRKSQENPLEISLELPFNDLINTATSPDASIMGWAIKAHESIVDAERVMVQEYSEAGTLESQTKADETTTLFNDHNQPVQVLDKYGATIIEYFYGANNDLERIYLGQARANLPKGIVATKAQLEEDKRKSVLAIAERENKIKQDIKEWADAERERINDYINQVQEAWNELSETDVSGRENKKAKSKALEQLGDALSHGYELRSQIDRQEAEAYRGVSVEVYNILTTIDNSTEAALLELSQQEAALKREILRQEISPIVYNYYRRILGRDPSSQEYDYWISRVIYESEELGLNEKYGSEFQWVSLDRTKNSYIEVPYNESLDLGDGDFTIDLWVNLNDYFHGNLMSASDGQDGWKLFVTGGSVYFVVRQEGGSQLYMNANWEPIEKKWFHLAVVRDGRDYYLYVDGKRIGQWLNQNPVAPTKQHAITIGKVISISGQSSYFDGAVSDVRITPGESLWLSDFNVHQIKNSSQHPSLLLRSAATRDRLAADYSSYQHTIIPFGKVGHFVKQDSRANPALAQGMPSIAFDGQGDYLELEDSDDFSLGDHDFTMDMHVSFEAINQIQPLISHGLGNNNKWQFFWDSNISKLYFYFKDGDYSARIISSYWRPVIGQWYHIGVLRKGSEFYIVVDGNVLGYLNDSHALPNIQDKLRIGTYRTLTEVDYYFKGQMDQIRLSNKAISFEALLLTSKRDNLESDTLLLIRSSSALNNALKDESAYQREYSLRGDAKLESDITKFKKYSFTSVIKNYLEFSPELIQRTQYVNTVKSRVRENLESFLTKSTDEKLTIANSLGVGSEELINLTSLEAMKILDMLEANPQNLHFGQSAFFALEDLLTQRGISFAREDIAWKAILIDILTGVITPLDAGEDLVISLDALNKVAKLYNLNIQSAKFRWEDLLTSYQGSSNKPKFIAHINGNHYVVITDVTAESISFMDFGIGESGESVTITKEAFLKSWKGYLTGDSEKIQSVIEGAYPDSSNLPRVLSASESRSIRGAFWGSILGFIGSILSWVPGFQLIGYALTAISAVVSTIEGDFISAISAVVTLGFGNFGGLGDFFSSAFKGVTQALGSFGQFLNSAGQFIGNIYNGVKDVFTSVASGFGSFVSGLPDIVGKVVRTAVATGINIGVSKGLEALGLPVELSGFIGNLAAGSFIGASRGDTTKVIDGKEVVVVSNAQYFRSSVQQVISLTQVGRLGLELGLDSSFTNIIALSFAAMQGDLIQGGSSDISQAFSNIKPTLIQSLSQFGVEKLFANLGLDPNISVVLGRIGPGLVSRLARPTWANPPDASQEAGVVMDGEYYYDERRNQEIYIPGPTQEGGGFWNNLIQFLSNNFVPIAMASTGAYFLSQQLVAHDNNTSPDPVPIKAPIPNGAIEQLYQDMFGETKDAYRMDHGRNHYEIYDRGTGRLLERYRNGLLEKGTFRSQVVLKADGTYGTRWTDLVEGHMDYLPQSGGEAVFQVQDGNIIEIHIEGPSPDILLEPNPIMDGTRIIEGIVQFVTLGLTIAITNGSIESVETNEGSEGSGLSSGDIVNRHLRAFIFANGFNNKSVPENQFDNLIPPYVSDLESDGVITNSLQEYIVPLYEVTGLFGNAVDWASDFLLHLDERQAFRMLLEGLLDVAVPQPLNNLIDYGLDNFLVDEAYSKLIAQEQAKGLEISDGIVFVHSGGLMPMLGAIERTKPNGALFDVKTLISYEGVYIDDNILIDNPHLKRVINVWGTATFLGDGDFGPPIPPISNFQGTRAGQIENINIRIIDAFHNDFSYDDQYWINHPPTTPKERDRELVNRATNLFMRRLYARAAEDQYVPGRLVEFLSAAQGVTFDSDTNSWTVDPRELVLS